jgi:thiol-disulfide isomerase/thioredoxin
MHMNDIICEEMAAANSLSPRPPRHAIIVAIVAVLAFIAIPIVAMIAHGDEGLVIPKGLSIPTIEQPAKLEIVVNSKPFASGQQPMQIAEPIDASVIVEASGKDATGRTRVFNGSGTLIGNRRVLTCEHLFRELVSDVLCVIKRVEIEYPATVLMTDKRRDLSVLQIGNDFPCVEIAAKTAPCGADVISIGSTDGTMIEHQHQVVSLYKNDIVISGQEYEGRSGGGVFSEGRLVGVVQARAVKDNRSICASVDSIKAFLSDVPLSYCNSSGTLNSSITWKRYNNASWEDAKQAGKPMLVFVGAGDWCVPCNSQKKTFTDPRIVELVNANFVAISVNGDEEKSVVNGFRTASFPTIYVLNERLDFLKIIVGAQSVESMAEALSEYSKPVLGAISVTEIHGWSQVQAGLQTITDWAGDGAVARLHWIRRNGLKGLEPTKLASMPEMFGTTGRIEFTLTSAKKLPVHELKFNYRFDSKGKPFIDPDEFGIDLPGVTYGSSPNAKPTGSVALLAFGAYELLTWGYGLYEVLHPKVSIWPGDDLDITATLTNGGLNIDLGPRPPAVHVDWSLCFGLFGVEYQRALTGAIVNHDGATAQFHKAKFFKDVKIVGK